MKIQYQDYGAVANIVITSSRLTLQKHNRVVMRCCLMYRGSMKTAAAFSGLSHRCQEKHATSCAPTKSYSGRQSDEVIPPVHAVWSAAGVRRFRCAD